MDNLEQAKKVMKDLCPDYRPFYQSMVLGEGIEFDRKKRTVKFLPNKEINVNTSINDNPTSTMLNITIGGEKHSIEVFSIFQRMNADKLDGNPLIYAYKGQQGWTFESDMDRRGLDEHFTAIAKKFVTLNKGSISVISPSDSPLNSHIAKKMKQINPSIIIYGGVIEKMSTDEILDLCYDVNSPFWKYYSGKDATNEYYIQIESYLDDMDKNHSGTYARHFVKDKMMRNLITQTMRLTTEDDTVRKFACASEDKDVIIIGDSISMGDTLREMCTIILSQFNPKSITCLTLQSSRRNP